MTVETRRRIDRDKFERALAELEAKLDAEALPPSEGIHGSKSLAYDLSSELLQMAGAGRATLMQLAHPFVAQGIADHSEVNRDPFERFRATFENIYRMVLGSREEAFRRARAVYDVHSRIEGQIPHDIGPFRKGSRYSALDVEAVVWVYSTLVDTTLLVHERLGNGMPPGRAERFYQESKRLAHLFGLEDSDLPMSYQDFQGHMRQSLASLHLTPSTSAKRIAESLLRSKPGLRAATTKSMLLLTTAWLPRRLRRAYGLVCSPSQEARVQRLTRLVHWGRQLVPVNYRMTPQAFDAVSAARNASSPPRLQRAYYRALAGGIGLTLRA